MLLFLPHRRSGNLACDKSENELICYFDWIKKNSILSLEVSFFYSPCKKIISEEIQVCFCCFFWLLCHDDNNYWFKVVNPLSKGQRGRWMLFLDRHLYIFLSIAHSHSDSASNIHVLFLLCFCSLWYPLFPFT